MGQGLQLSKLLCECHIYFNAFFFSVVKDFHLYRKETRLANFEMIQQNEQSIRLIFVELIHLTPEKAHQINQWFN